MPTRSTACSTSTCRSPERSPIWRPGSTAYSAVRALERFLLQLLALVEDSCRYCSCERTSQVHLLPEALSGPRQRAARTSGLRSPDTGRAQTASGPPLAGRSSACGGPTPVHLSVHRSRRPTDGAGLAMTPPALVASEAETQAPRRTCAESD